MRTWHAAAVLLTGIVLLATFYLILLNDRSACDDTDGEEASCIGPRAPMALFYGGVTGVLLGSVLMVVHMRRRARSDAREAAGP